MGQSLLLTDKPYEDSGMNLEFIRIRNLGINGMHELEV